MTSTSVKKKLDAYLIVLVDSELKKLFAEKAKLEDRNISSCIRNLMRKYVEGENQVQ
jgi:hypothetical protein